MKKVLVAGILAASIYGSGCSSKEITTEEAGEIETVEAVLKTQLDEAQASLKKLQGDYEALTGKYDTVLKEKSNLESVKSALEKKVSGLESHTSSDIAPYLVDAQQAVLNGIKSDYSARLTDLSTKIAETSKSLTGATTKPDNADEMLRLGDLLSKTTQAYNALLEEKASRLETAKDYFDSLKK